MNTKCVIFSNPYCNRCAVLKKKFDAEGIDYIETFDDIDIENLEGLEQFPVVYFNDKYYSMENVPFAKIKSEQARRV